MSLDRAKYKKRQQRHHHGINQRECISWWMSMYGASGTKPPAIYDAAIVAGAARSPRGIRLFQSQLKTHHEIHPLFLIRRDRRHDRRHLLFRKPVVAKNFRHFFGFDFRQLHRLAIFPVQFGRVMFRIRLRGQIAAQIPSQSNQPRFPPAPPSPRCAVDATAPVSPAASANGTVNPSDIPITMSRTAAVAVKCFSTCSTDGILALPHPHPEYFQLPVPLFPGRRV